MFQLLFIEWMNCEILNYYYNKFIIIINIILHYISFIIFIIFIIFNR